MGDLYYLLTFAVLYAATHFVTIAIEHLPGQRR